MTLSRTFSPRALRQLRDRYGIRLSPAAERDVLLQLTGAAPGATRLLGRASKTQYERWRVTVAGREVPVVWDRDAAQVVSLAEWGWTESQGGFGRARQLQVAELL